MNIIQKKKEDRKMKKLRTVAILLALTLVLGIFAACGNENTPSGGTTPISTTAEAADTTPAEPADKAEYFVFESETFDGVTYYKVTAVSDAGKQQKILEVPKQYEGLNVAVIEKNAFAGCTALEEVTFHSTVREIYADVFPDSKNLKKIHLDFADLAKELTETPEASDSLEVALASDGSATGANSFVQGLDETKVKMVFSDQSAYDVFSIDYKWAHFANMMTVEK